MDMLTGAGNTSADRLAAGGPGRLTSDGGSGGARLTRKPGSVDSLLDWDSDSTRPPSIPPRRGKMIFLPIKKVIIMGKDENRL